MSFKYLYDSCWCCTTSWRFLMLWLHPHGYPKDLQVSLLHQWIYCSIYCCIYTVYPMHISGLFTDRKCTILILARKLARKGICLRLHPIDTRILWYTKKSMFLLSCSASVNVSGLCMKLAKHQRTKTMFININMQQSLLSPWFLNFWEIEPTAFIRQFHRQVQTNILNKYTGSI